MATIEPMIEHEPVSAAPVCRDLREIPHGDFQLRLRTTDGGFVRHDPAETLAATAAYGGGEAAIPIAAPARWIDAHGGILGVTLPVRPGRYRVEVLADGASLVRRDIWMIDDDAQIEPMWAAVKAEGAMTDGDRPPYAGDTSTRIQKPPSTR